MRHIAVSNIYPNVHNQVGDLAFDVDGNPVVLDEKKVADEIAKIQLEYDSKSYQRDREYPAIGDQLDLIYWDKINGTEKWKEAIEKVKADHPKPE